MDSVKFEQFVVIFAFLQLNESSYFPVCNQQPFLETQLLTSFQPRANQFLCRSQVLAGFSARSKLLFFLFAFTQFIRLQVLTRIPNDLKVGVVWFASDSLKKSWLKNFSVTK